MGDVELAVADGGQAEVDQDGRRSALLAPRKAQLATQKRGREARTTLQLAMRCPRHLAKPM